MSSHATSSSSSSSVATATATDSSPATVRLYRHALESVFGFLSLADLGRVMAVSRSWSAAFDSMHSLGAQLLLPYGNEAPPLAVTTVCASRLCRHVCEWLGWDDAPLSGDQLMLLAFRARSLTKLQCVLTLPHRGMLMFPPRLQKLCLTIANAAVPAEQVDLDIIVAHLRAAIPAEEINAALRSVSQLKSLQSFDLCLDCADPLIDFTPLQSMTCLEEFGFGWPNMFDPAHAPSAEQIDQVRAMPNLTRMHFFGDYTSIPTMLATLRTPHQLKWKFVGRELMNVNAELAQLLPALPTLTRLTIAPLADCDLAFLTRLPNLVNLRVNVGNMTDDAVASLDSLVSALQRCPQITELNLLDLRSQITFDHISAMMPHFTNLRSLTFCHLSANASLSFLTAGPVTRTLTALTLDWNLHPLDELKHLQALESLTELSILNTFVEMDAAAQSLYSPPSRLLPKLRKFTHSPRPY